MAVEMIGRIKGIAVEVDPNIIWPEGYNPRTFYPLKDKWYRAARITSNEPKPPYDTPIGSTEIRALNASRTACGRCKGRGSKRHDGNIGCPTCLGRGSVPRH